MEHPDEKVRIALLFRVLALCKQQEPKDWRRNRMHPGDLASTALRGVGARVYKALVIARIPVTWPLPCHELWTFGLGV